MCGSLNYGDNACPGPYIANLFMVDFGQDGISYGMVYGNGRSGKFSHSNDVIGACLMMICE